MEAHAFGYLAAGIGAALTVIGAGSVSASSPRPRWKPAVVSPKWQARSVPPC